MAHPTLPESAQLLLLSTDLKKPSLNDLWKLSTPQLAIIALRDDCSVLVRQRAYSMWVARKMAAKDNREREY